MNERQKVNYALLAAQAEALMSGQNNKVANAANLSALIFQELPEINWAGFYFLHEDSLILGPFQGLPACVEIPLGKGVCGTAAATRKIQRVSSVHDFEGHIACDTASESELVIPLVDNGELIGVLDIDSPVMDRFGPEDEAGIAEIAELYIRSIA
jgi:L-methionine (R)-S-oxide reductase